MIPRFVLALWLLTVCATSGWAFSPDERLRDPALEARARGLSAELRCLVCRNESIDDSNADLARDLRLLVRRRLTAGDTDAQVLAYMTQRYGDYVLLRPPVKPATYLLWFGTPALLAGLLAFLLLRRRTVRESADPLSDEERGRLQALLNGKSS